MSQEPPATERRTRKRELRQHYRCMRREGQPAVNQQLRAQVAALLGSLPGSGRVGLYVPLPGEADLLPLASALPRLRPGLALPAVNGGQLHYLPWQPGDPLAADACGIPAPSGTGPALPAAAIDLLLIPALAIDHRGIRLGYGGGWYDRLRSQAPWRQVPTLAVLPRACLAESLPRDPWDIPLQGWVNELGTTWLATSEQR
ncbi:MAG: 5-formyltetrahydrofolate cyclo-ligase [Cyanobacteria bacterium M_surface_10_m2_119]|nr:5-formyltetrahydrofolate cyclo-ligase [Cyanobacteria bacterium M_surface_10_m2_119]